MAPETVEKLEKEAMEAGLTGRYAAALSIRVDLERHYDEVAMDPVVQVSNLNWLALMASYTGDQAEAIRAAQKSLLTYGLEPVQRDVILAKLKLVLSYVLSEGGRFSEAIPYAEEALAKLAELRGEDDVRGIAESLEFMRKGEVRAYLPRIGRR